MHPPQKLTLFRHVIVQPLIPPVSFVQIPVNVDGMINYNVFMELFSAGRSPSKKTSSQQYK